MKKKKELQYRYYEMPEDSHVLALMGRDWVRKYGDGITYLHFHNYMEIGICHEGCGDMVYEDTVFRFEPGCFTVIPPNYPHTTNSDPGTYGYWEYLFVDCETLLSGLYPKKMGEIRRALDLLYKKPHFFCSGEEPLVLREIREIFREQKERGSYFKLETDAHLTLLLLSLLRIAEAELQESMERETVEGGAEYGDKERLQPALRYLEKHYTEEVYIRQLADACALSETHFRRLFQELFHMTPLEYVNSIRIHEACKALRTTDKTIRTIAFESGFTSISTFQRNFQRFVGMPTHEWRNHPDNYEYKLQKYKINTYEGW